MSEKFDFDEFEDYGIVLRVLRPADGLDTSKDVMSSKYARLTLLGVVDCIGMKRERGAISPLPEVPQDGNAPCVWLLRGRYGEGHRAIVPADDRGEPMLSGVIPGGNYATSNHPDFWSLVGYGRGAVTIYDLTSDSENADRHVNNQSDGTGPTTDG